MSENKVLIIAICLILLAGSMFFFFHKTTEVLKQDGDLLHYAGSFITVEGGKTPTVKPAPAPEPEPMPRSSTSPTPAPSPSPSALSDTTLREKLSIPATISGEDRFARIIGLGLQSQDYKNEVALVQNLPTDKETLLIRLAIDIGKQCFAVGQTRCNFQPKGSYGFWDDLVPLIQIKTFNGQFNKIGEVFTCAYSNLKGQMVEKDYLTCLNGTSGSH